MTELEEPPYVAVDENLTAHRCDGPVGNRTMHDTYFTGIEHRRKGAHTCFQIAFLDAAGARRAHLRFVEVAWPRPQSGWPPGPPGAAAPVSAELMGKAGVVLKQALQAKLA